MGKICDIEVVITLVLSKKLRFENGDEMSEQHYLIARARTCDSLLIAFLLISCLGSVTDIASYAININWHACTNMIIGILLVLSGYHFYTLEKEGTV